MLKQLSALILFSALSYPQTGDSLAIQSFKTNLDTIITSRSDSSAIVDTSKITEATKKDTLVPIQGEPLTDVSNIINKRTFLFDNYRYTGDLLRSFSFNFIKDLGFIGYPNESFIYGVGDNGISYLQDGVLINNRFTNSLDLNLVQSEDIDSIEIVPSPRGFLYGPYNNPVTVNFITKDFISTEPYSRVKYYEGPDGEAMIDGKFNARIIKRWNLGFQVTNRKFDSTYTNTEFSIWQVNTKLKYFLSNSVNITGSYYFVHSKQGMNGGVDYDSLGKISDNPNSDLYNPFIAPVVSPNQKLDVLQHNFRLRALAKPFNDSQLDLSIYYRYGLDELRDFRDSLNISNNKKNKIYGAAFNYYCNFDFVSLQLLGDYEKLNYELSENNGAYTTKDERYNAGVLISLHTFDEMIKLSFYYKTGHWKILNMDYEGIGLDLKYSLNQTISFYAGYSIRDEIWLYNKQVPSFETGIQYKYSGLMLDLKYVSNEYFNHWNWLGGPEDIQLRPTEKVKSIGLNFNIKFWFLLLETNTSYYFKVENQSSLEIYYGQPNNRPDLQFIGGLFVNDMFFNDNLDLKTGFKFYYTGKMNSYEYYWQNGTVVGPTNKLDFTLAGEIKKVAIVYFIWENLFGNQYYITPYYPMPERNIRFGLAWELFN